MTEQRDARIARLLERASAVSTAAYYCHLLDQGKPLPTELAYLALFETPTP